MYGCPALNIILMTIALIYRGLEQPAVMVSLWFSVGTIIWFTTDFLRPFQKCQEVASRKREIVLEV